MSMTSYWVSGGPPRLVTGEERPLLSRVAGGGINQSQTHYDKWHLCEVMSDIDLKKNRLGEGGFGGLA